MSTHNKVFLTAREIDIARLLDRHGKLTTKEIMDLTSRCRGDVNYLMKALARRNYVTFTLESIHGNVPVMNNSYYVWSLSRPFNEIMKRELRLLIDKAFNGDTKQFLTIANEL